MPIETSRNQPSQSNYSRVLPEEMSVNKSSQSNYPRVLPKEKSMNKSSQSNYPKLLPEVRSVNQSSSLCSPYSLTAQEADNHTGQLKSSPLQLESDRQLINRKNLQAGFQHRNKKDGKYSEKFSNNRLTASEPLPLKHKEKQSETVLPKRSDEKEKNRGKRFHDRLECLSQNFNLPPDNEIGSDAITDTKTSVHFKSASTVNLNAIHSTISEHGNKTVHISGSSNRDIVKRSTEESTSTQKKGRTVRASLSLSRKDTPKKDEARVELPLSHLSTIKTEPEDDGYFRPRKKPRLCKC